MAVSRRASDSANRPASASRPASPKHVCARSRGDPRRGFRAHRGPGVLVVEAGDGVFAAGKSLRNKVMLQLSIRRRNANEKPLDSRGFSYH